MKKYVFLFVLAITLFSCSSDDTSSILVNPELLQRVDFYPNTANETRWNFNDSGILDHITKADGTLIEKFIYDSNNNVIRDTKYNNGSIVADYVVTYNSSNIITTINGQAYNYIYSAAGFRYFYSNATENFNCEINNDLLLTEYTYSNSVSPEKKYEAVYTNSNMISFQRTTNGSVDLVRNYSFLNVINGNPLRNACLGVLKLKSLTDPEFFKDGIFSRSVLSSLSFESGNSAHYNFGLLINSHNYLSQHDIEVYDGDTFVEYINYSKYYYQGDDLP
ncbi:hypothetical protein [Flavobacterium sangjuense]|uniref:DUF4595 domain-containing protein n=1 Tax=Flavobacterium sangjuense TaxID=2518177 RepID=A0A4P7PS94_9FLAO|nr:hypothetical protein [Flavobacterium sangjuense]QBZ96693.1 hypothetical protein GS03_00171 [Flavobacterium sangjuense]